MISTNGPVIPIFTEIDSHNLQDHSSIEKATTISKPHDYEDKIVKIMGANPKYWNEEAVEALCFLIEQGDLPEFLMREKKLFYTYLEDLWPLRILDKEDVMLTETLIKKYQYSSEDIHELREFNALIKKYNFTASIKQKIEIQKIILENVDRLKGKKKLAAFANLPDVTLKEFENNHKRLEAALLWIENNKNIPGTDPKTEDGMHDIIALSLEQGNYKLALYMLGRLNDVFNRETDDTRFCNKALFHFILDRYWPKDKSKLKELEGNSILTSGIILALSIQEELEELKSNNKESDNEIIHIVEDLLQAVIWCARWKSINTEEIPFEVVQRLGEVKEGQPILIPCIIASHATSLSVEKRTFGKVRLTLHNTGSGINKHHGKPYEDDLYRIQTYLVIEDVPLNDLLDVKRWDTFFQRIHIYNIDELYIALYELGKNGKKAEILKSSLHYQGEQEHGVCSAKNLMTFFWRYVVGKVEGSDVHKQSVYEVAKKRIIKRIGMKYVDRTDSDISILVKKQLEKSEAKLQLFEQLKNPNEYEKHRKLLVELFDIVGDKDWVQTLSNSENLSSYEQYFMVAHAHKKLAKSFIENPKLIKMIKESKLQLELKDLTPCYFIYRKRQDLLTFYNEQFNEMIKKEDWKEVSETLCTLYFRNVNKQAILPVLDLLISRYRNTEKWGGIAYIYDYMRGNELLDSFYRFLQKNSRQDFIDIMEYIKKEHMDKDLLQ